jgi:hypothetical protein
VSLSRGQPKTHVRCVRTKVRRSEGSMSRSAGAVKGSGAGQQHERDLLRGNGYVSRQRRLARLA